MGLVVTVHVGRHEMTPHTTECEPTRRYLGRRIVRTSGAKIRRAGDIDEGVDTLLSHLLVKIGKASPQRIGVMKAPYTASQCAGNAIGSATVIYKGNATSFTDTGLTAGTQYFYKFYAENFSYYSGGVTSSATANI